MKIGLVPVSAKPYHAGHHALVSMAAGENDKVILFVSTSDRKRKGQFPILGIDMVRVWQEELENIMPSNVEIKYGGSPVRKVWDALGAASDDPDNPDTYVVYSDPVDTAQNYPETSLEKYCGDLRSSGQCVLAAEENPGAFTRGEGTPNISGTAVREMLEAGDFQGFAAAMPAGVNSQNIFDILTHNKHQQESLLRNLIRATILSG
jgi:hypothetical protein